MALSRMLLVWHLVECLSARRSLLFSAGEPRERDPLVLLTAAAPTNDDNEVVALIDRVCRGESGSADATVDGPSGPQRVVALPVVGPDASVFAVQVWIARPDIEPSQPRQVGTLRFNLDTLAADVSADLLAMSSAVNHHYPPTVSVEALLRKVLHCDDMGSVGRTCHSPAQHGSTLTRALILHDHGHLMRWQLWVHASADFNAVHVVAHDISDAEPPTIDAPFVNDHDQANNPQAGLVVLCCPTADANAQPVATHWITEAPEWLHPSWNTGAATNFDLIHPDHWQAIRNIQGVLGGSPDGTEMACSVAARGSNDQWIPTRISMARYPGAGAISNDVCLARFERDRESVQVA